MTATLFLFWCCSPHSMMQVEPGRLPTTITAAATATAGGIVPAGNTAAAVPMSRFQNLAVLPPETVSAVMGFKTGVEWLRQRQRPDGRFVPGIDLANKKYIIEGSDVEQATAAWALAAAARFTGDEKTTLAAGQAILAMLTLTTLNGDGTRVPTALAAHAENHALEFAAVLVLAIAEMPEPDDARRGDAVALCRFMLKECGQDGGRCWQNNYYRDRPGREHVPGLVMDALTAMTHRPEAAPAIHSMMPKMLENCKTAFSAAPTSSSATTAMNALAAMNVRTPSPAAQAMLFTTADWLVARQATATTHRDSGMAGGIVWVQDGGEPNSSTASAVRGLAAACSAARAAGDRERYKRYRGATVEGLGFLRRMQFTPESATALDAAIKPSLVVGGQRTTWNGGTITLTATAQAVLAYQRYLESGAELRD